MESSARQEAEVRDSIRRVQASCERYIENWFAAKHRAGTQKLRKPPEPPAQLVRVMSQRDWDLLECRMLQSLFRFQNVMFRSAEEEARKETYPQRAD